VDLDARLVERWMPGADRPEIVTDEVRWQLAGAAEPCVVALDALFAEALGERQRSPRRQTSAGHISIQRVCSGI
jgi:hypothetical protein